MFSKTTQFFSPQRPLRMPVFFWIAAVTILLDQLSKIAMNAIFHPLVVPGLNGTPELSKAGLEIVLIPNLLQFWYRINTGAAFSALTNHTGFLTAISVVISLFVVAWAWFLKPEERGLRLSQGLIFGGAIGNLIDRFRLGYVIDFIDAHWKDVYHWPTFNIADSAICVGIFLLAVASFCATQPEAGSPEPPADCAKPVVSKKSPGTS